jgi:glycosyltransferase involved in cell wall biosynthesis
MKNLLYIGNSLSKNDKTVTTIDTLSKALVAEGYVVKTASKEANVFFRLLDMLYSIVKNKKRTDYVLIDTYSTLNFYYAFFVSQLCRFLNLKYIPILHGGNLPKRLESSPKLSKALFSNAYKNIAPSVYILSNFKKFGSSNLVCIPNAIEIENYQFKERVYDEPRLLWVRSFSEIYNPNLAIDVLYGLIKKGIKVSLCMVGPDKDGSLQKAKNYANELNLEVNFTGKLEKDAWVALASDYNIFINTTNIDNMPVSVIEAMALGLPVVSTNVGGIPFLIDHEHNGILVEPNNAEGFIEAIEKLMDRPRTAEKLVEQARKTAEKFDWKIIKKEWNEVLH